MFIISSKQIAAFQPNAEDAFIGRVMNYLRENHSEAIIKMPDEQKTVAELPESILRPTVHGGIKRGGDYGISWQSTLLSFVVLMFLTAPNFDEHPKVANFLTEREKIDDNDLESLMNQMTDEDWAAVAARYNAESWNQLIQKGENQ